MKNVLSTLPACLYLCIVVCVVCTQFCEAAATIGKRFTSIELAVEYARSEFSAPGGNITLEVPMVCQSKELICIAPKMTHLYSKQFVIFVDRLQPNKVFMLLTVELDAARPDLLTPIGVTVAGETLIRVLPAPESQERSLRYVIIDGSFRPRNVAPKLNNEDLDEALLLAFGAERYAMSDMEASLTHQGNWQLRMQIDGKRFLTQTAGRVASHWHSMTGDAGSTLLLYETTSRQFVTLYRNRNGWGIALHDGYRSRQLLVTGEDRAPVVSENGTWFLINQIGDQMPRTELVRLRRNVVGVSFMTHKSTERRMMTPIAVSPCFTYLIAQDGAGLYVCDTNGNAATQASFIRPADEEITYVGEDGRAFVYEKKRHVLSSVPLIGLGTGKQLIGSLAPK